MNKNEKIIAIIGCDSYIGSELTKECQQLGYGLRLINRKSINLDIFTNNDDYLDQLTKLLDGVDFLVNLASVSNPFTSEKNINLELENLALLFCILKACKILGIHDIVYSSSGGVIYEDNGKIHNEEEMVAPICFYGIGKHCAESYLRLHSIRNNSNISVLRISNPYGRSQILKNGQGIIPYIHNCLKENKDIILYGNTVRDYIYIDDVVRSIIMALENNKEFNIYNIGTGIGTSLIELSTIMCDLLDRPKKIKFIEKREFDINHNVLDINKANTLLKWYPKYNLQTGLIRYFNND